MRHPKVCATRARRRGVTLFEVLIVVAIIALGSARVWLMSSACPGVAQLVSDGVLDADSAAKDPWGTPWRIECNDNKVTVSSNGKDRIVGTGDDIRVPPANS